MLMGRAAGGNAQGSQTVGFDLSFVNTGDKTANLVLIRVGQTEMGQGVFTNCPIIVAEELQCDWTKVRSEYASANRDVKEKAPAWTIPVPGKGNDDPAGGGEPAGL